MKFSFTFLFSLFFVISAFAQPQKGDYFFGTSNIAFNHFGENSNLFSTSTTFGAFVKTNTLVGGALTLVGNSDDTATQVAVFVNQFIGKGRVKGLTSFQLTHVDGVTFSDVQLGLAFFPTDNASVNLVYRVLPFAARKGDFERFPNKFRADIGLSMRFFILRNREKEEAIMARNSIKEGTKVIGLSGNFSQGRNTNVLSYALRSKSFLKDNFFLSANLGGLSYFTPSSTLKNAFTIVPQIGAGYYVDLSENFALHFSALLSLGIVNNQSFSSSADFLKTRTKSGLIMGGFAFFKGRHKIEPTIGLDLFTIGIKDAKAESVNAANFQIKAEYEYFLSQNTSLIGQFTVLPQNKTFRASRFAAEGDNTYGFYDAETNSFSFLLGLNYYITR